MDPLPLILVFLTSALAAVDRDPPGVYLGSFSSETSPLTGDIFALNDFTLLLSNVHYKGDTPLAFHVAKSSRQSDKDYRLSFRPTSSARTLESLTRTFNPINVLLPLPVTLPITQFQSLSVRPAHNPAEFLASVSFPSQFETPPLIQLQKLATLSHDVQSKPVLIIDDRRLLIPGFYYDGLAPDAYFWVGKGKAPNARGMAIPDEKGSPAPLTKYDGENVELALPEGMTVRDVDWLAIWCLAYKVNMGWVAIPTDLPVTIPSSY